MNSPVRTALLADVHGNSPALQAVLEDIQRHQCAQVFVLGDIINGLDPHGCLALLKNWAETAAIRLTCLKGNAEFYLLTPDLDAIPENSAPWNAALVELIRWYQAHLTETDLAWIRSFADWVRWNGACLVHDSPVDRLAPQSWHIPGIEPQYQEWFYHSPGIQPDMAEPEWRKLLTFMEERQFRQVFCAHTHVPFCRQFGQKRICNVGSVGLPTDGDPHAAWVLVEEKPDDQPDIAIRRVDYDIARMLHLIDQTPDYPDFKQPGFHEGYKKMVSTGVYWKNLPAD
jgi:predicted phosphodiesterase